MKLVFSIIQIVISALLILAILLQHNSFGLGETFGGSGAIHTTKRGIDKILFNITIGLAIVFFLVALGNLLI